MTERIALPYRPPSYSDKVLKKGDKVRLDVNGRSVLAKFINHGRFTNTFLVGRNQIIYLTYYGDLSKEILLYCNPKSGKRNPHIPKIINHGLLEGPKDASWNIRVYESEFYEMPVKKKHGLAWDCLKELEGVRGAADLISTEPLVNTGRCYKTNRFVADNAEVPVELSEALYKLVDSADNYGPNYLMEHVWPRNYGVDKKGRLVLVDPFYDVELWKDGYKKRERK
jgi:hypothetical protein